MSRVSRFAPGCRAAGCRALVWRVSLIGCTASSALLACSPPAEPVEEAEPFPNRRPQFEAEGRRLGFVTNRSSDTVSVLDLDAMKLLGDAPVGRDPVDLDGPSPLAIDAQAGIGYTTLSYPQSVVGAHELAAGSKGRNGYLQALDLRDFAPVGEQRILLEPLNVTFDAGLDLLAVSHSDTSLALNLMGTVESRRASVGLMRASAFEPAAKAALDESYVTACVLPGALAFGKGASYLYVVCTGEDALGVMDPKTRSLLRMVSTTQSATGKPGALVVGNAGLLVANELPRTVALLSDAAEPQVLAEVGLTGIPRFGVFVSDTEVLVPARAPDTLSRIDLETASVTQTIEFTSDECQAPASVNLGPNGEVWLVCESDHYRPGVLVQLDPGTLQVQSSVALGLYPTQMAVLEP